MSDLCRRNDTGVCRGDVTGVSDLWRRSLLTFAEEVSV